MIVFIIFMLLFVGLTFTCTLIGVRIGMDSNRVHKSTMNNVPPGNWFLRITSFENQDGDVYLTAIRRQSKTQREIRARLITLNLTDDDFPRKLETAVQKAERNLTELNSTIDVICQ